MFSFSGLSTENYDSILISWSQQELQTVDFNGFTIQFGAIDINYCNAEGERHRDGDKPASIVYDENGKVQYEEYYKDGNEHRDGDKPAYISYYENGQVRSEDYYKDGVEYFPAK